MIALCLTVQDNSLARINILLAFFKVFPTSLHVNDNLTFCAHLLYTQRVTKSQSQSRNGRPHRSRFPRKRTHSIKFTASPDRTRETGTHPPPRMHSLVEVFSVTSAQSSVQTNSMCQFYRRFFANVR